MREVPGEERQHEERGVPRQPGRLVVGEAGSDAGDLHRDRRGNREGERRKPGACGALCSVVAAQDELLPEPPAVLARELAGEVVDVAHALHRDEESLVWSEAGRGQLGDLVPEMVLELVDVVPVDSRCACNVRPPLRNLRFDALHGHAPLPAVCSVPRQTSLSARETVSHWRRCSSSAPRPSSVIA